MVKGFASSTRRLDVSTVVRALLLPAIQRFHHPGEQDEGKPSSEPIVNDMRRGRYSRRKKLTTDNGINVSRLKKTVAVGIVFT